MDFTFPANRIINSKEVEKRNKHLDPARELERTMAHESDGDAKYIGALGKGLGDKKTHGDHPNYNFHISLNTQTIVLEI